MNKSGKSLIAAYCLDGKGRGRKLNWDEVEKWQPEDGFLWIHLDYTKTRTHNWLKKDQATDQFVTRALISDETRPRCHMTPTGTLLILRSVNMNPGQDPEDMVSVRMWISKHRIITTRRRRLNSIDEIINLIDKGDGPTSPADVANRLIDSIADRVATVVEDINDQVDELEESLQTETSYSLRPRIADVRRQAIAIRRYLAPQREALSRLISADNDLFSINHRVDIRENNDRIIRYIEDLDSARERAAVTQEELMGKLSEQLDSRMYTLSLVAAIFLPLSFITGLLGINVGGIPAANSDHGFTVVCLGLSILFLLMVWGLHRRKWF